MKQPGEDQGCFCHQPGMSPGLGTLVALGEGGLPGDWDRVMAASESPCPSFAPAHCQKWCCGSDPGKPPSSPAQYPVSSMTKPPCHPSCATADSAPATLTCLSTLLPFFIPLMKSVLPFKCCSNSPRVMSPFSIRTCGMCGSAEMRSTLGTCPSVRVMLGALV